VLRRIFGTKRDEVTGEWRRLDNEEPYDICFSPNIIQVVKSRRRGWRSMWKSPLGRPRHRKEDNIKVGGGMD
jgi:hypothetical protein